MVVCIIKTAPAFLLEAVGISDYCQFRGSLAQFSYYIVYIIFDLLSCFFLEQEYVLSMKKIMTLVLGLSLLLPSVSHGATLTNEQKLAILSQIQVLMVELQSLKAQLEEIQNDEPEEEPEEPGFVSRNPDVIPIAEEIINLMGQDGTASNRTKIRGLIDELQSIVPSFSLSDPNESTTSAERSRWVRDFEDWLVSRGYIEA